MAHIDPLACLKKLVYELGPKPSSQDFIQLFYTSTLLAGSGGLSR